MEQKKYSIILGNLGNTCDRFLSSGYKETLDKNTMLQQASRINGVTGIELVGTWDIDEKNVNEMNEKLRENNFKCVSIIPDLFSQKKWGKGALTSLDKNIRQEAVDHVIKMIDIAKEMDCQLINLWPGQDGYDYPLCSDYITARKWFIEGVRKCAEYAKNKGVKIALEYKLKEPRTHSFLARVSDSLLMTEHINLDNVGVCIDTGHAFLAYENVGESIAMLKFFGDRLFHMHFNDNYSVWDDDMIVGSIHLVEYFEILFWLEKTRYHNWISMDQYPYREDGFGAIRSSVLFLQKLQKILDTVGFDSVEELIQKNDPVETSQFIREYLIA